MSIFPEPAEPVRQDFTCVECGAIGSTPTHRTDCRLAGAGYIGQHHSASVFDQPDAGTEYAREIARELVGQFAEWQANPGTVTTPQQDAWLGRAAAVLAELSR